MSVLVLSSTTLRGVVLIGMFAILRERVGDGCCCSSGGGVDVE